MTSAMPQSLHPLVKWHATRWQDDADLPYMDNGPLCFVSRCCFDAERELRRLARRARNGTSRKSVRNHSHRIAHGYRTRLYSVLKTAHKSGEKLTFEQADARAKRSKNYAAPAEKFTTYPSKKSNGQTRTIFKFGPIRKAQQQTLLSLVEATTPAPAFDFSRPGRRGTHGAIAAIGESLLAGKQFWIGTDVQNAFPSMTVGHALPHITVSKSLLRHIGFNKTHTGSARPELPQGGKHSSLICSAVIDGALRKVANQHVEKVAFVDNVTIGATTEAGAIHAFEQLRTELASLEAGPINLHQTTFGNGYQHTIETSHVGPLSHKLMYKGFQAQAGVWFCGYVTSLDIPTHKVRPRPNKFAFAKLKRRVRRECLRPLSTDALENVLSDLCDAGRSYWLIKWVAEHWAKPGYPEWKRVPLSYSHLANTLTRVVEDELADRQVTVSVD